MTSYKKIKTGATIGTLLLTIMGFYAFSTNNNSKYFKLAKNIELYGQIYKEVYDSYVDNVEPAGLMKKGVDAMMKSLDPYTNYISEAQIEGYRLQRNSAAGDIGVELIKKDNVIIIDEVYEEQGAYKAELRAGDKILAINGTSADGRTIEEVKQALTGQPGSELSLSIVKVGQTNPENVVVIRDKEEPNSVTFSGMLNDNTAYVKFKSFTRNCSGEVVEAFQTLQKNNEVKNFVLDLRGNGGGLLDEAIKVVNIFIEKGQLVVKGDGKTENWKDKSFATPKDPLLPDIPLVVLINDRSASASEIVSGTMQDLDRGIVIGQRSFGKGLVQQTKDVGYGSKIKLTVAKYYTPSGRCVQAIDYSGRYQDGASTMPDSLRKVFKTKNGRTVYDGSGVNPDIEIPKDEQSNVTKSLLNKHLIFDYATSYMEKKPTIASATEYQFTDKDFEEFVQFLSNKQYDYTTESEKMLEKLQKSAEDEKYAGPIETTINKIKQKITEEKEKDLYKNKTEIKKILQFEIISRYYFQRGEVEASLDDDPAIKEALNLFKDKNAYNSILTTIK